MGNGIEFASEVGRGATTFQGYPEEILLDPELNGRHENTDVESLAADIEANEQLEPVLCRKNDEGFPVLVAGHRRYRAFCLLNERNPNAPRKINFVYKRMSPAEAFVAAIGENRFRKDVSPIDDAANIEILQRRFGKTEEEIALIYFPEAKDEEAKKAAVKFVKDRAALIELAPEAAQAVRDGRLKITSAIVLSKLSREQQRKKVAKQGKIKGADIKKPSKKAPKISDDLKDKIAAVIDSAPWEDADEASGIICVNLIALAALKNYIEGK